MRHLEGAEGEDPVRGTDPAELFVELVRRHGDRAYRLAYRLAGNEADARDLVQEAFVRAFTHRESYDPARPFEAWLARILRNVYLDGVRRYAHRHTVSLDAPAGGGEMESAPSWEDRLRSGEPEPLAGALKGETEAKVQGALTALPVHYRAAVVLCDVEGLTYERIGEILDCPVGTVRSRIHQGRRLLRKAFQELEGRGKTR